MSLLPPMSRTSAKFDTIGRTYSGALLEIGEPQQATTFEPNGPGKPAFWDDEKTRPKMQRRFLIQGPVDPAIEGDDGTRAIYATIDSKNGSLYSAIHGALASASSVGGTLTVTFTGTDPLSKNPSNPRKVYSATYTDPTPGQILGSAPTPAAAAPAAAQGAPWDQQPAQAAPAAQAPAAAAAAPAGPPPGITDAAWAGMADDTKAAILAANAPQPPF